MNKSKYSEDQIVEKKLPQFYDYYELKDFDNVYEPAEDTFLLTDVLGLEKECIRSMTDIVSIEIGVGSGYVSTYFVDKYSDCIKKHICVDVNDDALKLTERIMSRMNLTNVDVVKSNLFENINEKVDIIIFNPV
jgi:methylase of polypeptide subunit release factors